MMRINWLDSVNNLNFNNMQSVVNYSFEPFNENLMSPFQAGSIPGADEQYLDELWAKVCLNDLQAYEALHKIVYPLLFDYACFILNDANMSDSIIADTFISFWYKRDIISGSSLKINLVKHVRREVLAYLANHANTLTKKKVHLNGKSPVTLLTVLNSSAFKNQELGFLSTHLNLDDISIALIMNYDNEVVNANILI